MSIWQNARKAIDRAKDEATVAARTARAHLDVRSLEGQRDRLFERLGRKVYAARTQTDAPNLDRYFSEIAALDEQIEAKKAEAAQAREGVGTDAGSGGGR